MDMLSCLVCLGGDVRQKVHRSAANPISWPEVYVLEMIHGRGNVQDMKVVSTQPDDAKEEKRRLASTYDPQIVEQVYPGLIPAMEMEAPGDIPRAEGSGVKEDEAPAKPRRGRPRKEDAAEDLGLPETGAA